MKIDALPIIGGVMGVACGLISVTPWLTGRWVSLIIWGVVGVLLGLWVTKGRPVVWTGLVYGFCLSVTFLLAGFQGSADKLPAFLALTLVLSVVGAAGGLLTVFVGAWLRRRWR
jgi:hypothetical protein